MRIGTVFLYYLGHNNKYTVCVVPRASPIMYFARPGCSRHARLNDSYIFPLVYLFE